MVENLFQKLGRTKGDQFGSSSSHVKRGQSYHPKRGQSYHPQNVLQIKMH